jgi:hypothetical protein
MFVVLTYLIDIWKLFFSMIELLRSIYLQQVKRDETQLGSSFASSMCQSIVQQLGNTT